ncbi:hypothetical protein K504DRAFT_522651 [Pleomassaria siparia CBS 279.74]|uniref:MHD domain-containing protein n=1 Tax=Pleomassaria siparia CBS 279.74 TaxID=1314801 RepID=A0A6G1KEZ9_9PLEO|nr:hypothetical protein K504DRAFT_522651 [Pleomassaria siparia CBS 279.74]
MELQRKEYPALLDVLPPAQAVAVLNERMKHVSQLNANIADWLQERRRVEEQYVLGLRKLANRHSPDETSDLGIFTTPWQKIIGATDAVAESHHQLATKIEADVERPLREFATSNREIQAMSTIQGNLAAMAKEIETSKKKSDKLRDKGVKASATKVASAVAEVENATIQWESQAPYVFEKLQAVDESRCNHLRDVLTQFQTHEVDQVERNRASAEESLNAMLNIETGDEIQTWSLKMQSGERPVQAGRKTSNPASTPSRTLAPPVPPAPSIQTDDSRSQKSGSVQEAKSSGGLQSLKRLGTVLGRRRQSVHPYGRAMSPERKSATNLATNIGSSFPGFGKGKAKEREPPGSSSGPPASPSRRLSLISRNSDASGSPKQTRRSSGDKDKTNGTGIDQTNDTGPSSSLVNGTAQESIPELKEPLSPPSVPELTTEPEKDSEGFSVPAPLVDPITEAEREAGLIPNENSSAPQFKLDIRNAPIQEEDGDADAAIANMASTLRAQAAQPRRSGTLRGRRDVRNSIFVPNPAMPDLTSIGEMPLVPSASSSPVPFSVPPPPQPSSPASKPAQRALLSDDHAASDTHSIRSGRSLSSAASTSIRHPELHEPGLNASLVEVVSAWFEQGKVTKAMVIGQVALAYNPIDISSGPVGSESIRLENFSVLEKVAPNPAFIEQIENTPGTYSVDLSSIMRTSVAFHYQVHLESSDLSTFAPIVLAPIWKTEAAHTSVLVNYSLNPAFELGETGSVTFSNLVLLIRLEPGVKATACQSKPPGTFSRGNNMIYWRLGEVTLSRDEPAQPLRARFFTESEAKPGNCEARFEATGDHSLSIGSRLGVSQVSSLEAKQDGESDPFADADENAALASPAVGWKPVASVKRFASGTYLGV